MNWLGNPPLLSLPQLHIAIPGSNPLPKTSRFFIFSLTFSLLFDKWPSFQLYHPIFWVVLKFETIEFQDSPHRGSTTYSQKTSRKHKPSESSSTLDNRPEWNNGRADIITHRTFPFLFPNSRHSTKHLHCKSMQALHWLITYCLRNPYLWADICSS